VDRNVLEKRAGELEGQTDTTPDLYGNYRRMPEANRLVSPTYRDPWTIPSV
jgi:hypothetical protein